MARNRNKRRTTEELIAELREFHHEEAAARLGKLHLILTGLGICEICGETDDICERKKWTPTR